MQHKHTFFPPPNKPFEEKLPEVATGRTDCNMMRQVVTESSSCVGKVWDGGGLQNKDTN